MKPVRKIDLSDPDSFRKMYDSYFVKTKYFAVQLLSDEGVAEDILQDTFIRIWEKGDTFDNENHFRSYLYSSIRNNCLSFLRDQRREEARMVNFQQDEIEESFVNHIIEAEVYGMINAIFEELPAASKRVYQKSLEGKSHKEIADELDITVNTIKRHKNIANHLLRDKLKKIFTIFI